MTCDCSPDLEPSVDDPWWEDDTSIKWFCFVVRGSMSKPMLACSCSCHLGMQARRTEWRTRNTHTIDPAMFTEGYDNFPAPRYR